MKDSSRSQALPNRNNLRAWILCIIMAVGFILRLITLGTPDMAGDDAHYSLRAIGLVDYVASVNLQSTPVSWFDEPRWWQNLSFHDAPPLVFWIQWFFFQIGGDNVWAARMPFVLAGTALIATVFLLGETVAGTSAGLAAAGAVAVMNYAVGASRIGLLDGFATLWSALAIYFFVKAGIRPKHYFWWGFAVGLGILTKYTFFFLIPVFAGAILAWRRDAIRNKWFWYGLVAISCALMPLVLYNAMMWFSRGHPDATLSTLIGLHPADFQGLDRETHSLLEAPRAAVKIFTDNFSIGFQLLFLWSIAAVVLRARRIKIISERRNLLILGLSFVCGVAIVGLAGGSDRYGVILVPLIAVAIGVGATEAWKYTKRRQIWVAAVLIAFALWESVFAVQTHLMERPILSSPLLVANNRPVFTGYRILENYVADFYRTFPEPSPIIIFKDESQLAALQEKWIEAKLQGRQNASFQKHLLVFDDRISWFAWVWIFERRRLYDSAPIHSVGQFGEKMDENRGAFYAQFGLTDATIILADEALLRQEGVILPDVRAAFATDVQASFQPIEEIKDQRGQVLFRVFRIPLAP